MKFIPDLTKPAQEIIFSREKFVSIHPVVSFNNTLVNSMATHKHLRIILDSKLSYEDHLQCVFSRVNNTIGLLRKMQPSLLNKSVVKIYKSFIRYHTDYGDVICDRASDKSFHQSPESIHYSAVIAITGTVRGTSSEKLFQELGLETLVWRRWLIKWCLFYKLIAERSPAYLFQLIPENNTPVLRDLLKKVKSLQDKNKLFQTFFPAFTVKWNKIDVNFRNSTFCNVLKRIMLKFFRPEPNQVFNVGSSTGLRFSTRIRLRLSLLADHKFRHNFQDCINAIYNYGKDIETSTHL